MSEEASTVTATESTEVSGEAESTVTSPAGDWSEFVNNLPEDFAAHHGFLSQFKDRDSFVKSAIDTKSAYGRKLEGFVKVPGEGSTDEEIAAYRAAVGVPASPAEYVIEVPEIAEGVEFDESVLEPLKEVAHSAGVSASALNALIAYQANVEGELVAAQNEAIQADERKLVNEWGDRYQERVDDLTKRVGGIVDLSQPMLSRSDVLRAMESMAKDFRNDDPTRGTPAQSMAGLNDQIEAIRGSDEYRNSAHPKHKETRARLHSLYSEQIRQETAMTR